jgi:asparagine N-glycosylation enzyme membrane subunit Stt3
MKLSSRFLVDGLYVIAGAFLTVAAMAWSAGTAGWTAFGVSAGVAVIAAASAVLATKAAHRFGHGLIALVAVWSLIAALIFSGSLLTWFVFGDAIALGVLALADLTSHEASTERVVHSLEVRDLAGSR